MPARRFTFSISNAFLIVTLIAVLVLLFRTRSNLSAAQSKLTELSESYSILDASDEHQFHALEIPSFSNLSDCEWRWRTLRPANREYEVCLSFDGTTEMPSHVLLKIPAFSSVPTARGAFSLGGVLHIAMNVQQDRTVRFTTGISRNHIVETVIENPPDWLLDRNFSKNFFRRNNQTRSTNNEALRLADTPEGFLIWIQPVPMRG